MDFIVDVQGFKRPFDNLTDFTLKEFAKIVVDQEASASTLLFEPPYEWNCLPARYKSENLWLERNLHGLSWNSGDICYEDIKLILPNLVKNARNIYVKGLQKKNWLQSIIKDVQIIDMLDLGCPSLETLKKMSKSTNCTHHSIPNSNCSAQNVALLRNWLLKYRAANPAIEIIPERKRPQMYKDMVWCHSCQKHHRYEK